MDARVKAARVSIFSNTALVLGKLIIGYGIHSVSVMSEAIHSGLDLVAAFIAYFSVRVASKPADAEHQYGHGKVENISGTLEALLIFLAAIWIIYEAGKRLLAGSHPVRGALTGVAVMAGASLVNYMVSNFLFRVARTTESIALEADAWHLRTDVYTSVGVLLGLLALEVTGYYWLDPLMALVVAAMIIKAAYSLSREAFLPLLDVSLPEEEERIIKEIIARHADAYVEFHKLRTRKAGRERQIDLHLVVPRYQHIDYVHDLCEHISDEIKASLPHTDILIHAEPCTSVRDCPVCNDCPEKEKRPSGAK
ncbi:cation diffusion facilitator family transporter [Neomoorella thermoacetica]|uniref:Predicted Co/Zn/Cd cation transporters n=1 Tax=Moorella thermoacetica Y72 TaxID=1325331 RepID=A0A0S6UB46_NEOTH|nr:cation diffusion facilitator family transporter [Moorella thermoacetica]APC08878.1 ferrous-iron efflux pump FieF [Moorella thermoacetica]OIQ11758.1 ferrous-iron efflux pump FieF [Moorella thermoacetica]GAF24812.1 predicted Co/Zn/Cd cation transporters [Moorella thermoacetica Y72]